MQKLLVVGIALLVSVPVTALFGPVRSAVEHHAPASVDVHATIVRDAWGVPHVYADDAYSLFYANGYAQAQDRLAQMEILRHVGKGELAKLTGPSGLALDLVTRRELYTDAERDAALAALDPYWQHAFEGYAAGVNRWIAEVRADPAKLPVEYPALLILPEDWHPKDTIAIAQYLLDVFGRGGGGQEVDNAKLLKRLRESGVPDPEGAFADLVWARRDAPRTTYTTIKPGDGDFAAFPWEHRHALATLPAAQWEAIRAAENATLVDDAEATPGEALAAMGWPFRMGSNAQLIAGEHTASGKPILFGGPQMAYYNPMIPYELGLHGAGFDVVGMGVAGAPGVIIGRNANMSWTVTSGSSDQVDTVALKLAGPRHYVVDGDVRAMDCRVETHLVRPGPADFAPGSDADWRPPMFDTVEQEVCRSEHGPVLWRTPDGEYAFASKRSYRGDELRSGAIWLQIGLVRSLGDFESLFETFQFTFNFNFATEDGHIAYYHVGRQMERPTTLDPRLPRPLWDSVYDTTGAWTGSSLPRVLDPESGWTVNWNNNPAPNWSSGDQRELWGSIHRAELMHEELLPLITRGGITLDDVRLANVNASTREPFADDFAPLLRTAASDLGRSDVVAAVDAWEAARFTYAVDTSGSYAHAAFRLYELWREEMQERVFRDELGSFVRELSWDPPNSDDPHAADHGQHNNKDAILIDAIRGHTARAWCDDLATLAAESCLDVAKAALVAALAKTTTRHCGSDPCVASPDWATPFPEREIRFIALGAGVAHRIPMVNRPSFQHFYDWGLPEGRERSRNALPPGASGHMNGLDYAMLTFARNGCDPCPIPAHSDDQLRMYVDFEDKPLLFDAAEVLRLSSSVTVL